MWKGRLRAGPAAGTTIAFFARATYNKAARTSARVPPQAALAIHHSQFLEVWLAFIKGLLEDLSEEASLALYLSTTQRAGEVSVDTQMSEHARVLLQPGTSFKSERVASIPAVYRSRIEGGASQIKHLWLWPQGGQVTLGLSIRKSLLGKSEEIVPLSAGAHASRDKLQNAIELRMKMAVFCTSEHEPSARYRVGQVDGLTVAARTGLANGLVVQVRSHPEAEVSRPTDPLAPLVSVAGRRLVLSPAWVKAVERGGLVLGAFPAQIASGVEFLNDLQIRERLWAILGENPALQPYLSRLQVDVRDGVVYLGGRLPMLRLRNSAKQDIWHVPGVVAIEDTLRIEGD
jgi:hypothetical protein